MTSPSDRRWHARSGLTLLETLVVLAILVLVMAAVTKLRPNVSDSLSLERTAATRIEETARLREAAIRSGVETRLRVDDACDEGGPIVFRPDGIASGPDICLELNGRGLRLALDPLTGRIMPEAGP